MLFERKNAQTFYYFFYPYGVKRMETKKKIVIGIIIFIAGILGYNYIRKKGGLKTGIDKPTSMGETARSLLGSITSPFKEGLDSLRKSKYLKVPDFKGKLSKLRTKATSATYSIKKRISGASGKLIKKTGSRLTHVKRGVISRAKTFSTRTHNRVARKSKKFKKKVKSRFTSTKKKVIEVRGGVGKSLGKVKGRVSKIKRKVKKTTSLVKKGKAKVTKTKVKSKAKSLFGRAKGSLRSIGRRRKR